ncbi:hypothetical protein PG997_001819 [Apiospora hydei]|uniref:Uncharacterized protein n=1 Tax=Apiospora hydei TaxID=1337664 RepID=A0ABR1X7V6_9PEZI
MHPLEAHSLASTNDEASQNETRYRSSTSLISLQGSQRTPPNEPQPSGYEMAPVNERRSKIPSQQPPGFWSQWWMEILNCFLMIATLCAIIGVLYPNSRKPVPDFPYQVSINTIVFILSTALKASIALVLAEGQPWTLGLPAAARCPCPARGQFTPILAAALTILTLALDPITQQLVRYYNCKHVSMDHRATLPRANMYDEGNLYSVVPTPVLGFIDQGLYNPGTGTTPFSCASGNCTFDRPFSTLGFCSSCEDMSSQLVFSVEKSVPYTTRSFNSTTFEYDTVIEEGLRVNTTLPSGTFASYGPSNG